MYFFPELIVLRQHADRHHSANSPDLLLQDLHTDEHPTTQPLLEKEWKFTRASSMQVNLALLLGLINISELMMFGTLLAQNWNSIAEEYPALAPILSFGFTLLAIYAVCFCVVPIVRWLALTYYVNPRIRSRNDRRKQAFSKSLEALRSTDAATARSIRNARDAMSRLVVERFGEEAVAIVETEATPS